MLFGVAIFLEAVLYRGGKDWWISIPFSVYSIEYTSIGCWADKPARAVPGMDKYVGGGDYRTRKDAIKKCFNMAVKKGLTVFAIQAGGWCAAGNDLSSAKKYGKSTACKDGKGGGWANNVYVIKRGKLRG